MADWLCKGTGVSLSPLLIGGDLMSDLDKIIKPGTGNNVIRYRQKCAVSVLSNKIESFV